MLIGETKLTQTDKLQIKNYRTYRRDRQALHRGGGVAILIKDDIPHTQINILNTSVEVIAVQLKSKHVIACGYNRPTNYFTTRDLDAIFETGDKVVLAADLNARHTSWNCRRNNRNGNKLNEYYENSDVRIHFTAEPTHFPYNGGEPSTIDLVLTKGGLGIERPCTIVTLDSDHDPVKIELPRQFREKRDKTKTNYDKTDWKQYRRILNDLVTINNDIRTTTDIENATNDLARAIEKAKRKCSRTHKLQLGHDSGVNDEVVTLIAQRNRQRRRWQRTGLPTYKDNAAELSRQIREKIKQNKVDGWKTKIAKLNIRDGSLFNLTKILKKKPKPIGNIKVGGNVAVTDREKAELIADFYENVHDLQTNDPTKMTNKQNRIMNKIKEFANNDLDLDMDYYKNNLCSPKEVHDIIRKLPTKKAPGPDGLHNILLKNMPRKAVVQLHYIINAIIRLQHFPRLFKEAVVIPIPKKGKDDSDPGNYRPISLLNSLGKVTEKILLTRLIRLDEKLKMTPDVQFGFRAAHNTTQQVARIVTATVNNFNRNKKTVLALLDIEKAFDRVWLEGLIHKLLEYGVPTNFVKLIHSYLSDRQLQVRVGNELSNSRPIRAGVPQGSVLGPKLFNIYISDIPSFAKTELGLYADDTAIFAHSFSSEVAARQVQLHLNVLQPYFDEWLIKANPNKTEVINLNRHFTNNKIITPVKMQNVKIAPSPHVKYLGVTLDTRLTFKKHLDKTLTTANGTLRQLYALMAKDNGLSTDNKLTIYRTIIRPILTYAAPVWCGVSKSNFTRLERFQNKCLRLITNSDRYRQTRDMLDQTGLETLREHTDKIAEKFYRTQLDHNKLLKNMTNTHKDADTHKHKRPFDRLDLD